MKKYYIVLLLFAVIVTLSGCGLGSENTEGVETLLVVGTDQLSETFNPFLVQHKDDKSVIDMTSIKLLTTDRDGRVIYNAIDGEVVQRKNVDHFYQGWTNISLSYDLSTNITTYNVEIKENVKFSDGQVVDANDIIFSYYVYLDPYYNGPYDLNSVNIVGYDAYKHNSSDNGISREWIDNIGKSSGNNPDLDQFVLDEIKSLLNSEYNWVKDKVLTNIGYSGYWRLEDGSPYEEYFNTPDQASILATLASFYSLLPIYNDGNYNGEIYSVVGKDKNTIINELASQYGYDYLKMDESYGSQIISPKVDEKASQLAIESGLGNEVNNISGIKIINNNEVEIEVNGFNSSDIYKLFGITVSPLHYYGDTDLYNYDANQFGFSNRTVNYMELIEQKAAMPMGAGPYKLIKIDENTIDFKANPNYYKGKPIISDVKFKSQSSYVQITDLKDGELDITSLISREDDFKTVDDNLDDKGNISYVDNLGYGYIGINALNVQVGSSVGTINSKESNALRKAFATVIASTRYDTINDYFGDCATIINYPSSNTSWAVVKEGEPNYEYAFVKDVNGNDIYGTIPTNLSSSERSIKAKEAAKGWLQEAGYTFTERSGVAQFGDKLYNATAPNGAKTFYKITIPGGGAGEHPAYQSAIQFKDIIAELGITIEVNDPSNANELWEEIGTLNNEMWATNSEVQIDPDLYSKYHTSNTLDSENSKDNFFYIKDSNLDNLITGALYSTDLDYKANNYKQAYNIIMNWAVEVPLYQRQSMVIFSNERLNIDTIPKDITPYWSWINEIEKLEIKQ